MHRILASLAFLCTLSFAAAQFPFFDGMFRQQQQQHQEGSSQWASHLDSVSCSQYLCPTLDCVKSPADCPCPDVEDVKCIIPDSEDSEAGTVICARGQDACAQVERLALLGR